MGHIHPIIDGDSKRFIIDPITRSIKNETPKLLLIKDDHNSERYTFELPRLVEGHDMSLCNKVEVHYININSSSRSQTSEDIYPIGDIELVTIDGEEKITGSWLISGNATKYVGPLIFALRFACIDNGEVVYSWNTTPHTGIAISDGINVSDDVVEEYSDLLQDWWNSLQAAFTARTLILRTSNGVAPDVCPSTIECEPDATITSNYAGVIVMAKYNGPNKYGQSVVMGKIKLGGSGSISLENCFYLEGQNGVNIESVNLEGTDDNGGNIYSVTVDGKKLDTTFTAPKGPQGIQGIQGWGIASITRNPGASDKETLKGFVGTTRTFDKISNFDGRTGDIVHIPYYITDEGNSLGYLLCKVTGFTTNSVDVNILALVYTPRGPQGIQGIQGHQGVSITGFTKQQGTNADGSINYTVNGIDPSKSTSEQNVTLGTIAAPKGDTGPYVKSMTYKYVDGNGKFVFDIELSNGTIIQEACRVPPGPRGYGIVSLSITEV